MASDTALAELATVVKERCGCGLEVVVEIREGLANIQRILKLLEHKRPITGARYRPERGPTRPA